jgi:hypothetical protein
MRFFAYALLAAAAASGCGETATPSYPADAGRDASIEPDAGTEPDGGGGGGGGGGSPDGGGGSGGSPDGGTSWCETSTLCPSCPDPEQLCDQDNPCPTGEACVLTGCEDFARCFVVGGGFCETEMDCSDPAYDCNLEINRCLRTEPGCDASNDCVAGFACEDGECVDRRAPCVDADDCPHGYTCLFATPDQRFCRRIARPCFDDLDCLLLGVPCGDPDGDGNFECMPSSMPTTPDPVSCRNSDCTEATAPVCQPIPEGTIAECGYFGPCSSPVQCATDFQCRDLWGDGRLECVIAGGSCVDSRDCAPRSVCATPRSGGAPSCYGGLSM